MTIRLLMIAVCLTSIGACSDKHNDITETAPDSVKSVVGFRVSRHGNHELLPPDTGCARNSNTLIYSQSGNAFVDHLCLDENGENIRSAIRTAADISPDNVRNINQWLSELNADTIESEYSSLGSAESVDAPAFDIVFCTDTNEQVSTFLGLLDPNDLPQGLKEIYSAIRNNLVSF